MGELITDEEIDMMISMVDLDGDGQVSFLEFKKLVLHPNPVLMDKDSEITEEKLKQIEEEKLIMAGKLNELDATTYHRQKELQQRENKKRMILNFLNDHEYDFDSLKRCYHFFLAELSKDQRIGNLVTFTQFCQVMKTDPINENNRLFNLFDPERMGKINMKEFLLSSLNFVNPPVSREVRLPFLFEMFDEDRTGYISLNEIREILKGNHMMSMEYVERKAQTMMKQATMSAETQSITLKEFLIVSKKFPNIILPNLNSSDKKDDY
jgi:Ca2+-binding EF-hand superfamily protein